MDSKCTTMDHEASWSLLKSILGFFARNTPETSTPPASLRSRALDAWVRTDAYLQHETDELGEVGPEQVARTLSAFESLVQYNSDQGPVSTVNTQQVPFFRPPTSCPLTQGCEAELATQWAVPEAPGGSQYDSASES